MAAALDNDIVIKGICLGLLNAICEAVAPNEPIGVLGTARFVVAASIRRVDVARRSAALEDLTAFLDSVDILDPTDTEQQFAADLEAAAQRLNVALDTGESQLCAIVIERAMTLLLTGDKRAIAAAERLIGVVPRLAEISGRLLCLEQATGRLLEAGDYAEIRRAVCAEPEVDKALTICFSCGRPDVPQGKVIEGLRSYVDDLRRQAPQILAP